jgi:hypothetical protein
MAERGTMTSFSVLTASPVDAAPRPVWAMALMLALRAVSAATEFALEELALEEDGERASVTVPATAFVSWVPLTVPPVALM